MQGYSNVAERDVFCMRETSPLTTIHRYFVESSESSESWMRLRKVLAASE